VEPHHLKGKEEVLEDETQVWYQVAAISGGSFGD
jgi:hypothetical protein